MAKSQVEVFRRGVDCLKTKVSDIEKVDETTLAAIGEVENQLQDNRVYLSIVSECCDNYDLWETDSESLFEAVITYKDLVHSLVEKIQELEERNSQLNEEIKKVSERYRLLERRVQKFEGFCLKSIAAHLGHKINEAVISKVLANIVDFEQEHISTIGDMEKAILGKRNYEDIFKTEEDKKKAELNWEKLKCELGWEQKCYRYLKKIAQFHMQVSHPAINLELIKKALDKDDSFPLPERELFIACLKIYERLISL